MPKIDNMAQRTARTPVAAILTRSCTFDAASSPYTQTMPRFEQYPQAGSLLSHAFFLVRHSRQTCEAFGIVDDGVPCVSMAICRAWPRKPISHFPSNEGTSHPKTSRMRKIPSDEKSRAREGCYNICMAADAKNQIRPTHLVTHSEIARRQPV